jgi:hypothetical protein
LEKRSCLINGNKLDPKKSVCKSFRKTVCHKKEKKENCKKWKMGEKPFFVKQERKAKDKKSERVWKVKSVLICVVANELHC